jgi:GT2 family glycosyltransferase
MLDDVGRFDERFFVYYEDLDLAWRARRRGWKFLYAPKAVVYHVHCGTSGEWSPFFVYHVERNRVFVSLKNAPWRLVIRSLAVFAARAARKWLRVLLLQERTQLDRGQAIAYVRAAFSLAIHAPEMLCKRLVIRMIRAKVSDRRLARLIVPPPSRLALSAIEQMEPHRHDS